MASTTSQAMPAAATAAFNPADVSASDAITWCSSQLQSCPEICGGTASTNICDSTSFTYICICSDGSVPDCTAYTGTLPFYICEATFSQCIESNPNDAQAQLTCTDNEVCGTKDPASVPPKSSTASSSASSATTSSVQGLTTSTLKSLSTTPAVQTPAHSSTTSSASKSTTKSSTSAASTTSGTSSATPTPTPEASSASRGITPGAIAGIGIGCALGALLIAGLIAFLLGRRRKSRNQTTDQPTPDTALAQSEQPGKTELQGDLAKSPSSGLWSVDMRDKPEMFTNANTHEMEDTGVGATLGRPWSAELPEHGHG